MLPRLSLIVNELFLRGIKLNISPVFISKSYFALPKTIIPNATHYFVMKILIKREIQQLALIQMSEIDFKDFMKLYKDYTKKLYWVLVNTTLIGNKL